MPLFQPSNVSPSSLLGIGGGTIDVNNLTQISWQVNGNVPMTYFKISILDTDGTEIKTYEEEINKFYPTDRKGNPQRYTVSLSDTYWSDWGLENGNDYLMEISQGWIENGVLKTVKQNSSSYIITRSTPTLSILTESGSVVSTVNSIEENFQANYFQEQGDNVDWVRWRVYEKAKGDISYTLINDTGVINTQVLNHTVNNMRNGNYYKILCTVQTTSGVEVSAEVEFETTYDLQAVEGIFTVDGRNKDSNELSWSDIGASVGDDIQGYSNDDNYVFDNGALSLSKDSNIIWDKKNGNPLSISPEWTMAWKGISNGLKNSSFELSIKEKTTGESEVTFYSLVSEMYDIDFLDSNTIVYTYSDNNARYLRLGNLFNGEIYKLAEHSLTTGTRVYSIEDVFSMYVLVKIDSTYLDGCCTDKLFRVLPTEMGGIQEIWSSEKSIRGENYNRETSLFDKTGERFLIRTLVESSNVIEVYTFSSSTLSVSLERSITLDEIGAVYLKFSPCGKYLFVYAPKDTTNTFSLYSYENGDLTKIDSKSSEEIPALSGEVTTSNSISVSDSLKTVVCKSSVFYYSETGLVYRKDLVIPNPYGKATHGFDKRGYVLLFYIYLGDYTAEFYEYQFYRDREDIELIRKPVVPPDYRSVTPFFKICENHFAYQYVIGKYEITYKCSLNKTYTGKTIYDIEDLKNTLYDVEMPITFEGNSLQVEAKTIYPDIELNATVKYLLGENTPLEQTYFSTNQLSVKRDKTDLHLTSIDGATIIATVSIPPELDKCIISINANSFDLILNIGTVSSVIDTTLFSQQDITAISLYGEQSCDWLYISNETATLTELFQPTWGFYTAFLTHFELGSLQAGQLNVSNEAIDIYRENAITGEIQKVYSCPYNVSKVEDYTWITNEGYTYYAYARLDNKYTSGNLFNTTPICKRQNYFLLFETTQDENEPNVYHVINYWRFGNNVNAGAVGNNNTPSFLTTFTPYRLKQPSERNSKSGTLTALISNAQGGVYKDTVSEMEALYNLSKSNNTLFLKDTKGNLYMVTVSGAITQTVNYNSNEKETSISIPWEEIGDSRGVSIIKVTEEPDFILRFEGFTLYTITGNSIEKSFRYEEGWTWQDMVNSYPNWFGYNPLNGQIVFAYISASTGEIVSVNTYFVVNQSDNPVSLTDEITGEETLKTRT